MICRRESREDLRDEHSRKKNHDELIRAQPLKEIAGKGREEERRREVDGEAVRDRNTRAPQLWGTVAFIVRAVGSHGRKSGAEQEKIIVAPERRAGSRGARAERDQLGSCCDNPGSRWQGCEFGW